MEYLNEEGLAALWDDTKEYVEKYHGEHSGGQDSDGTDAGPIVELTAKGHAEQFTTLGKNLAHLYNGSYPYTYNSVTWTKLDDDRLIANGSTPSSSASNQYRSYDLGVLPAGTYTVSLRIFGGTVSGTGLYLRLNSGEDAANGVGIIGVGSGSSEVFGSITADGNTHLWVTPGVRENTTATNLVVGIQVELGSTATDYEPYTGGAPSPSPDYPQEIQVVRGRNLFDVAHPTYQNMVVNANELMVANNGFDTWRFDGGAIYTFSGVKGTLFDMHRYTLARKDGTFTRSTSTQATFSVDATDYDYLYISIYRDTTFLSDPQLEHGSVAHGYVPYGDYAGLEAQGRNLLDVNTLFGDQPSNFNINNDGTITVFAGESRAWSALNSISLTAGKYIFYRTNSSCPASATVYGQDGSVVAQRNVGTQDNPTLLNVPADGTLKVRLGYQASSFPVTTGLMLNKGDHAIPYEPYYHSTTPIPLPSRGWAAGLPDGTADTLTLDGAGKVVWERKTDEFVYDGSSDEVWYKHPSTNRLLTVEDKLPVPKTNGYPAIATHYRDFMAGWDRLSNGEFFISNDSLSRGVKYVAIHDDVRSADVSTWTTWLQSNPITILYPLATPVTESRGYIDLPEIPEGVTLSIPELDALGVRYITDDAAAAMARKWYERAKSEYEDRIASLEEAVAELVAGA